MRPYTAMIWRREEEPPMTVSIAAESLEQAKAMLEAEYGEASVYYLRYYRKLYRAMIWLSDDEPGIRASVHADNLHEAREKLEAEYGKGTVFLLRNEEDANKLR